MARQLPLWSAGLWLATAAFAAEIRFAGSDLLGPDFIPALEKFGRENDTRIIANLTGTRPGLDQLRSGDADIGLFALPPGESPPGAPLVARVIAYQPVVVVARDTLPLPQLTVDQVRSLFAAAGAGSVSNWGELGLVGDWRSRPILVHAADPAATLTLALARRSLLNGAELRPQAHLGTPALVRERVRAADGAVGLCPCVPEAGSGLRALALAATLKDSAYLPTPENLHDGSYPARLPLYVAFRREAAPRLLPLLRHLLGDECGEVLAKAWFQPLPLGPRNQLVFEFEDLN